LEEKFLRPRSTTCAVGWPGSTKVGGFRRSTKNSAIFFCLGGGYESAQADQEVPGGWDGLSGNGLVRTRGKQGTRPPLKVGPACQTLGGCLSNYFTHGPRPGVVGKKIPQRFGQFCRYADGLQHLRAPSGQAAGGRNGCWRGGIRVFIREGTLHLANQTWPKKSASVTALGTKSSLGFFQAFTAEKGEKAVYRDRD